MPRKRDAKERPVLVCRNVTVSGRRTSLRMEPLLWDSLKEICEREDMTIHQLCSQIDQRRGAANLTAAIRIFIVSYYRGASPWSVGGFSEEGRTSGLLDRAMEDAIPLDDEDGF